ncbi:MAG: nitrogen fixation protein NifX [Deltaproteobacteria bacterium]|jgi:nitrogen fixation protein NifX|nr:nitrogen fixation protein NifX [Deltaproteobacteria bacterium]MCL5879916.1 nitrogen fixation protein NifX [Deltaproteobacteria bacterium]MDA8304317.1 nitrogen fixation protein NifX [Deltaproteobacteria bacterium]
MKVGFATTDNILINDHFGWAKNFAIYEINREGFRFLENRHFEEEIEELDKIDKKVEGLKDLKIIFVESIGGTAAARVVKSGIHPIKSKPNDKIEDVMNDLKTVLSGNPPPWLKKIILKENGVIPA